MSAATVSARTPVGPSTLTQLRPTRAAAWAAFRALLARDRAVLRKEAKVFVLRTIMQPLLLLFVFTYVFPRIGQGIGGAAGGAQAFSTMLVAGVVATAMIFQGIQAVALPLVREFGYTREIEDRVLAPLPVWAVAVAKITSGAMQALLAGLIVFPLALVVPVDGIRLHVSWLTLLTVAPLAAVAGASLGLAIGTRVQPHQVPLMFSVIVLPMTFLGATYYPWAGLTPIPWLKVAVLANPLVYMSEGFRMALTPVPAMPAVAVYGALVGFTALLAWLGIGGFRKRVLG
ncbi:MAG: ABC transporter permease [Acidimicrobiia bacterium]